MFKDRDIICFLGDSITSNGMWIAEIYQLLRKKYQIKCYNCGVSGGMTIRAQKFIYANCLCYNPDYVVTMFGINDIARWWYSKNAENVQNRQELLDKALYDHKIAYENIINKIFASGAKPIICTPPPYDEISDSAEENLKCQFRMDEAVSFQKELAKKYNIPVVDFSEFMKPMLKTHTLINPDRVHPNEFGHHVMAQVFLKDIGEKDDFDLETPFVMEEWNQKRKAAEAYYKPMDYVEFCDIFDLGWAQNKTNNEKREIVKERYDKWENKNDYIPTAYKFYMDNIDFRQKLIGDVVELTIF